MDPDTAIRRLAFVEARTSSVEALANLAQHRREMLDAAAQDKVDSTTDRMADRVRDEQQQLQAHLVDKSA